MKYDGLNMQGVPNVRYEDDLYYQLGSLKQFKDITVCIPVVSSLSLPYKCFATLRDINYRILKQKECFFFCKYGSFSLSFVKASIAVKI